MSNSKSMLDILSPYRTLNSSSTANSYAKEIDSIMYRSKRNTDNIFADDPLSKDSYNSMQNPSSNFRLNSNFEEPKPNTSASERIQQRHREVLHKPSALRNPTTEVPAEGLCEYRNLGRVYDDEFYDKARQKANDYHTLVRTSGSIVSNNEFSNNFAYGSVADSRVTVDPSLTNRVDTSVYKTNSADEVTFSLREELSEGYTFATGNLYEPFDGRIDRIADGDLLGQHHGVHQSQSYADIGGVNVKLHNDRESISEGERMIHAIDLAKSKNLRERQQRQIEANKAFEKTNHAPRSTVKDFTMIHQIPTYDKIEDLSNYSSNKDVYKQQHKAPVIRDKVESSSKLQSGGDINRGISKDSQHRKQLTNTERDVRERFVNSDHVDSKDVKYLYGQEVSSTNSTSGRTHDGSAVTTRTKYSDEELYRLRDAQLMEELIDDIDDLPKGFVESVVYGIKSMFGFGKKPGSIEENGKTRTDTSLNYNYNQGKYQTQQLMEQTQPTQPTYVAVVDDSDDADLLEIDDRHTLVVRKNDKILVYHRELTDDGDYDYIMSTIPLQHYDDDIVEEIVEAIAHSERSMKDKRQELGQLIGQDVLDKDLIELDIGDAQVINAVVDMLGDEYKLHSFVPVDKAHRVLEQKALHELNKKDHEIEIDVDINELQPVIEHAILDQEKNAGSFDKTFKEQYRDDPKKSKKRVDIETQIEAVNSASLGDVIITGNKIQQAPSMQIKSQINKRENYGINSAKPSHKKDYRQITKRFDSYN